MVEKALFSAIVPSERHNVLKAGLLLLFTSKPLRSCREHFLCRQRVCLKGFFYAPKVDQLNRFFLFSNIPHMRVHNRFGGMRDLAFFRGDIRDLS